MQAVVKLFTTGSRRLAVVNISLAAVHVSKVPRRHDSSPTTHLRVTCVQSIPSAAL